MSVLPDDASLSSQKVADSATSRHRFVARGQTVDQVARAIRRLALANSVLGNPLSSSLRNYDDLEGILHILTRRTLREEVPQASRLISRRRQESAFGATSSIQRPGAKKGLGFPRKTSVFPSENGPSVATELLEE